MTLIIEGKEDKLKTFLKMNTLWMERNGLTVKDDNKKAVKEESFQDRFTKKIVKKTKSNSKK